MSVNLPTSSSLAASSRLIEAMQAQDALVAKTAMATLDDVSKSRAEIEETQTDLLARIDELRRQLSRVQEEQRTEQAAFTEQIAACNLEKQRLDQMLVFSQQRFENSQTELQSTQEQLRKAEKFITVARFHLSGLDPRPSPHLSQSEYSFVHQRGGMIGRGREMKAALLEFDKA